MRPYRDTEAIAKREAPQTLECWLRDGDKGRWIRSLYVKLGLTLIACIWVVKSSAALAAIPLSILGVLWAYRDVRQRKGEGVVLRVERQRLMVERRSNSEPIDLSFDELLDVRLDTKTIQKNVNMARRDGVNTVFGMGSQHEIGLDVSRIELVTEDDSILLAPEFISHSLCSETLRSIRLFLRSHGWKPLDERPEEEPTED